MSDIEPFDTTPSADRKRSYDGGYMAAGKRAEEIVLEWLMTRPWVVDVEDLRPYRPMREADVDCSIALTDGRVTLAEIKSDRHLGVSKNFLFEVLRINHTAPPDAAVKLGWSARSPARYGLLYAPVTKIIHKISMDDYRAALQDYTKEVRRKTNISYVETDRIKSTVNILIPERFVTVMPSYKPFPLEGI